MRSTRRGRRGGWGEGVRFLSAGAAELRDVLVDQLVCSRARHLLLNRFSSLKASVALHAGVRSLGRLLEPRHLEASLGVRLSYLGAAAAATNAAASVAPTTSTSVHATDVPDVASVAITTTPAATNAAASIDPTLAPFTTTCAPEGSATEASVPTGARGAESWCPVVLLLCFGSHSAMHAWRMCCLRKSVTRIAQPPVLRHIVLPAFTSTSRSSFCCKPAPWLGEALTEHETRKDNIETAGCRGGRNRRSSCTMW